MLVYEQFGGGRLLRVFWVGENDKEKVIECLGIEAKRAYDAEKRLALEDLENDVQRGIYLDWWYGKSLLRWNKETKDYDRVDKYECVSDYDFNMAHGRIMETIFKGMG